MTPSADDRSSPGDRAHDPSAGQPGPLGDGPGEVSSPTAVGGDPTPPSGEVYDWYRRALDLLATGNPEAAAALLGHAAAEEPESTSVQEAMARALFDARRYGDARTVFAALIERRPDDDYAHFGLGLCLARSGEFAAAVEHLAMAATMRPGRAEYVQALRETRATLRARARAGLPPAAS